MVIPTNPPGHWQHFILRNDNRGLTTEQIRQKYLKEQLLFENYVNFVQQQQLLMSNAASGGGPLPSSEPQPPSSGDLTLVFSNFDTVDLLLAGGYDSLPDWNIAIVGAGNPYTSISVDEPNFTVYLSGGSNITLDPNAFNGIYEGGLGLGEDLISIVDTGTIIESNGNAFYSCYILETVILPALAEVLINDFYACTKLKQVQLPSVTAVGEYSFFGAFNTANSPITLNLPLCTSYGANSFLQSDGFGGYVGTTDVDSPKVMNATFSTSVIADPEITLLLAENSGIVPTYV
jgi:hypothetical protein